MGYFKLVSRIFHYCGLTRAVLHAERLIGRRTHIAIVAYHRICNREESRAGISDLARGITHDDFEQHVRSLTKWYKPISLSTLEQWVDHPRQLATDAILFTFDDGYVDTVKMALPILDRHRVSATIFVATAYLGDARRFWWVRVPDFLKRVTVDGWAKMERAAPASIREAIENVDISAPNGRRLAWERISPLLDAMPEGEREATVTLMEEIVPQPVTPCLSVMTEGQCRHVVDAGHHIGGHTHTHPKLTESTDERVALELSVCAQELEAVTPGQPAAFAYPAGAFDSRITAAMGRSTYRLAFTTRAGFVTPDRLVRFEIPRIYFAAASEAEALCAIAMMKLTKYLPERVMTRMARHFGQQAAHAGTQRRCEQ